MKKVFVGFILSMVFSIISLPALASGNASLTFSNETYAAHAGERFDVMVRVKPSGEQIDTVRVNLAYDPSVVQVQAVSLVGLLNRAAPANYFDNATGRLSWAGFSTNGSLTSDGDFARITFIGVKEGSAKITIGSDSHVIANGVEKSSSSDFGSTTVNVTVAPTQTNGGIFTVNSLSHPAESSWYKVNTVDVSFAEVKSDNPIKSYLYAFDDASNTDPTTPVPVGKSSMQFKAVADGTHYFHLKAVRKDGSMTPAVTRAFNVDVTPPNQIDLTAATNKFLEGESVWFTFATTDETSGVTQYQIAMNDSQFQTQVSPLEITDVKAGTYFFRVAAIDRAGNTTYGAKSVRVYPKGTDIGRPANYKPADESIKLLDRAKITTEKFVWILSHKLLITFVLVVLIGFGIIYVFKKKKN